MRYIMANDKKMVEQITSMDVDFAQWYTDVVKKADLVDYSSVKGCMIIRPYGYAIWENIQSILDGHFKRTGHENVYMPMFIPESLLQKEKDHVEGFAPEVAWVTHGGSKELEERMCIRPTSETLFSDYYATKVKSYRINIGSTTKEGIEYVLYEMWKAITGDRPVLFSLWGTNHKSTGGNNNTRSSRT